MKALPYNKKELANLKQTYFLAKTFYETNKESAEDIQRKVLEKNVFLVSREWTDDGETPERITRPFDSYLMEESAFQNYLNLCYTEYEKAGIADKRGREFCPEAEAFDLYLEAEKQLVLYGIDMIPDGMAEKETLKHAIENIKYKEAVLNLVLRLD